MRKSGQSVGNRDGDGLCPSFGSRSFLPNRWSHSGPERYVIVAISARPICDNKRKTEWKLTTS